MGKEDEGRAEPVQIKLRPKGVGIGFSDDEMSDNEDEIEAKEYIAHNVVKKEQRVVEERSAKRIIPVEPAFDVVTLETTVKTGIIDMTKPNTQSFKDAPLASFLPALTSKRRTLQSSLSQKQFELDSALRQLERNINEVEKERAKLKEIQRRNDIKRAVGEFIGGDFEFEGLCDEIERLVGLYGQDELIEKAIISVLIPQLKAPFNYDQVNRLRNVLPPSIYDQIIYNLWWPAMKHPHFTAPIESSEDWQGAIDCLKEWAPILPETFLVSFLGNQILMPRLHSLLLSLGHEDCPIIKDIWAFLIDLKFNEMLQVLEKDLITWLSNRILKVQPKSFILLLKESKMYKYSCESAWLQRCERLLQRDLIIDPSDQDLLPIECILKLHELGALPASRIAHVLTTGLIPKLKKCVQKWMNSPSVDYEEVAEWYLAWKELFPEELLQVNDEELMNGFGEILNIINEAL